MRYFLALILSLLGGVAQAQTAPVCIPGAYGDEYPGAVRQPLIRLNSGWAAWGWCRNSDGTPRVVYRACAHGECVGDIGAQAGSTLAALGLQLLGSDAKTVYGGWWAANPPAFVCDGTPAAGTPRGNLCAEITQMQRAQLATFYTPPLPPPPPPASAPPPPAPIYTYHVKPNGVALDRPVYGLSGTTLTLRSGRALVGQPCDITHPTKASGTSGDLYAEFGRSFAAGVVALCAK